MKKGKLVQLSKSANYRPSQGSTVTVYDLFHAAPVRKKCLNECLELEWIKQRLEAFALIHPLVSFSLRNDATGSLILQTHKSNSVVGAFAHLFGVEHSQELCQISNQTDMFQVNGYVSRVSHNNRNVQFVFVNNRLVMRTRLHTLINCILSESLVLKQTQNLAPVPCQTAMKKCENYCSATFQPGSPEHVVDKHGIYIIMITCPLNEYEITFDPSKTLVEFRHWDTLLKCVKNSLWECLQKEGLIAPPNWNDGNEAGSSPQSPVSETIRLTQDTRMTDCEASVKYYGKGIHACNISNNLQSNTVRRPVKDVMNVMEGSDDPAMLTEWNETKSQDSSQSCISHGTIPGVVLSAASDCTRDTLSGGHVCDNKETTSKVTLDSGDLEAEHKNCVGNNNKASTSCVISDNSSCRSEAIFKSNSPTKVLQSHMPQHSGNNSISTCTGISSIHGTNSQHCHIAHKGHPESNSATQTLRSYKASVESISLTRMLQSSGDAKEDCSDGVIFRDQTVISLGTHDNYSSMKCLKDPVICDSQHSVHSTRAQLAPLKTLKEQFREELSNQSYHLSSSLRSFKRDFSTKNKHKLLAGLCHVREKLSVLSQPCARDKTRVSQANMEHKEFHFVDRMTCAELGSSNLVKSHTSKKCTAQVNQPGREHLFKQGHFVCQSNNITGQSNTGGITQSCPGIQCQHYPARYDAVESNDTNIVAQNSTPNVHKRPASGGITSPMFKMTQYHNFSKRGTNQQMKQKSDQSVNLSALNQEPQNQQVNKVDSNYGQYGDQVNQFDSNYGQCGHQVNIVYSNYGQCGDQANIFDSNYGQCSDQVNRFDSNYSQCGHQVNRFNSNYGQCGNQVNKHDSNYGQCGDQVNRFNSNFRQYGNQVDRFDSNYGQCGDQVNRFDSNYGQWGSQRTAIINVADEAEISTEKQPKSDAADHPKSFLTSEHLLLPAQWVNCREAARNVEAHVQKHLAEHDQEIDISKRVTTIDDGHASSCDTTVVAMEDTNEHLGGTDSSTVLHDSCLEDCNKGINSTIDDSNTFSVYVEPSATNNNRIHETIRYVGSPYQPQCGIVDNRPILHSPESQNMEMMHSTGSADDRQDSSSVTSNQGHRNPAMIVCNSEYDVEFVPLTDSVDADDLESISPGNQQNLMDVDMSPHVSNCSQESEGFQVSILTDELSPSVVEQGCSVDTVGVVQQCSVSGMSTQTFHVTSGCSVTEMTTQPFEITSEFQKEPTELDNTDKVTIPISRVSTAQAGPDNHQVSAIFNITLFMVR